MSREEKRLQKLCDEASEIAADNIEYRDKIQRNRAELKAMAELIKAKGGRTPDDVIKELNQSET